jgi:hypothetical protein
MEVEALIQIKFGPDADIEAILKKIEKMQYVEWVNIAFGATSDAVAYVKAPDNGAVRNLAVKINGEPGVASTVTQIMA